MSSLRVDRLAALYTMDPAREGLGALFGVSLVFDQGRLVYLGDPDGGPAAAETLDGRGLIGMPGLVDPHTHTIFAGSRAEEFRQRLAGVPYTAILEAGGGILSTVRATRAASVDELLALAQARLARLAEAGVSTVEVKSGYGLDVQAEVRILEVAGRLGGGMRVIPTFLGAHAIPAEHRGDRRAYVRQVIDEQLPRCAPLAEAIDVYCDRGAFTLDEAMEILTAGQAAGLRVKAHAEQVAYTGIAAAAAGLGAISVDHLERIDEAGVAAVAAAGTVAVLLPMAQLYLRDSAPPVGLLREAGVPMALGTDWNPGSSPACDPWAVATLATLIQGLTVEEAALGLTRHAGRALGRPELGWLGPGSAADLALFAPPPGALPEIASLIQHFGGHRAVARVIGGRRVDVVAPAAD